MKMTLNLLSQLFVFDCYASERMFLLTVVTVYMEKNEKFVYVTVSGQKKISIDGYVVSFCNKIKRLPRRVESGGPKGGRRTMRSCF